MRFEQADLVPERVVADLRLAHGDHDHRVELEAVRGGQQYEYDRVDQVVPRVEELVHAVQIHELDVVDQKACARAQKNTKIKKLINKKKHLVFFEKEASATAYRVEICK